MTINAYVQEAKNELICHLILNIFSNGQIPQMTRRTYEWKVVRLSVSEQ